MRLSGCCQEWTKEGLTGVCFELPINSGIASICTGQEVVDLVKHVDLKVLHGSPPCQNWKRKERELSDSKRGLAWRHCANFSFIFIFIPIFLSLIWAKAISCQTESRRIRVMSFASCRLTREREEREKKKRKWRENRQISFPSSFLFRFDRCGGILASQFEINWCCRTTGDCGESREGKGSLCAVFFQFIFFHFLLFYQLIQKSNHSKL